MAPMEPMNKLTITFLLLAAMAFAKNDKLAADLPAADSGRIVEVIVQFNDDVSKMKNTIKKLLKTYDLDVIAGSIYSVPASELEELANDPNVKYISPVRPMKPTLDYATAAVNGTAARAAGYTGKGVGIAIIDSGNQLNRM